MEYFQPSVLVTSLVTPGMVVVVVVGGTVTTGAAVVGVVDVVGTALLTCWALPPPPHAVRSAATLIATVDAFIVPPDSRNNSNVRLRSEPSRSESGSPPCGRSKPGRRIDAARRF